MDQAEGKPQSIKRQLAAAVAIPFTLMLAYLLISRELFRGSSAFSDYTALVSSIAIGAVFVARLPVRLSRRILLLMAYLPLFGLALAWCSFIAACYISHDCV